MPINVQKCTHHYLAQPVFGTLTYHSEPNYTISLVMYARNLEKWLTQKST